LVYRDLVRLAPRQLDMFRSVARATPMAPIPVPLAMEPAPALELPFEAPELLSDERIVRAQLLAQKIANVLGAQVRVSLTVHDNRSTMMSFKRQPPVLKIRVHHMFLDASDDVIQAMADYAGRTNKTAGDILDDFISKKQAEIRAQPRNPNLLEARGQCFDLREIFDAINEEFFQGGLKARIGWGRHTSRRRRKSIRLGVYDHKAREIRVHPVLDKPEVPKFFVEYIVFHEMLHQLFPSYRHVGRNVHHPKAFRDREKSFPKYSAAIAWESEHLSQLLRG
jgi:hypothetical protein